MGDKKVIKMGYIKKDLIDGNTGKKVGEIDTKLIVLLKEEPTGLVLSINEIVEGKIEDSIEEMFIPSSCIEDVRDKLSLFLENEEDEEYRKLDKEEYDEYYDEYMKDMDDPDGIRLSDER